MHVKRLLAALGFVTVITLVGAAFAQNQTILFKIISQKDEVVIGINGDELRTFGPLPDLDNLAQHLASAGEMTVWQYAVKKNQGGDLQQAPLRRIAIFKNDTLRIEPYATPLPVINPAQ
jgi:hypothetical protein